MNIPTPLQNLPRLGAHLNVDLRCKRDDLTHISAGGNKVRKLVKIIPEVQRQGCDALVTTGGVQSNHARVTAQMAARKGWKCRLVLHGDRGEIARPRGNLALMYLSGADIEVVDPSDIASTIDAACDNLRAGGYMPYLIPGGGHCVHGAIAYVEAAHELGEQCSRTQWYPEWIVLASGTGTTQAGLIVGVEKLGWDTRVLGVSVARRNPRGKQVVEDSCRKLRMYLGATDGSGDIDFRDDWVGQGYEKAGPEVHSAIRLAAETEGLILDPTYTGKAFLALLDLVKNGEIPRGSKVLFWHTGGLLNLMASDLGLLLKGSV